VSKIRELKAERERIKLEEQKAERASDLARVAELRYGQLLQLERQLEQENARLARIQLERRMLKEEVDEEDIAEVVAKWTGIPVTRLLEGEIEKLVKMEERLHLRVVGQEDAVRVVSEAVRRARAGLQDPKRPIGSFLFLGPTGVGKTELARALAEFLVDDQRDELERRIEEALRQHFRPEFLNRVDETVIFHSLTREDLRKIVDLQVESLRKTLAERHIGIELTDAARLALADEGYDPHFGARPLKRTLQRLVQNPLAMRLLKGEFKPGQTIEVDHKKGGFTFDAKRQEPARVG